MTTFASCPSDRLAAPSNGAEVVRAPVSNCVTLPLSYSIVMTILSYLSCDLDGAGAGGAGEDGDSPPPTASGSPLTLPPGMGPRSEIQSSTISASERARLVSRLASEVKRPTLMATSAASAAASPPIEA